MHVMRERRRRRWWAVVVLLPLDASAGGGGDGRVVEGLRESIRGAVAEAGGELAVEVEGGEWGVEGRGRVGEDGDVGAELGEALVERGVEDGVGGGEVRGGGRRDRGREGRSRRGYADCGRE